MSEESQAQTQQPNYANEKARLECEKLKAEITAIEKPLLKTASFYTTIAPVALALIGVFFSYYTGWFDVQRTRISNDKTLLEAQTERLRIEHASLEIQAKEQRATVEHANEEIEKLRQGEAYLTNQVSNLTKEREELQSAKAILERETKRLAGADTNAALFLEQLKSLQTIREQLTINLTAAQISNVTLLATIERQDAWMCWANEILSQGWSIALKDKTTWSKFIKFGQNIRYLRGVSIFGMPRSFVSSAETQAQLDPRPTRSYEDDLRTESERSLERASKKSYDDYVREAENRYDLLHGVRPYNNETNANKNISPTETPPHHTQDLQ